MIVWLEQLMFEIWLPFLGKDGILVTCYPFQWQWPHKEDYYGPLWRFGPFVVTGETIGLSTLLEEEMSGEHNHS